jgi:hypothetical protein
MAQVQVAQPVVDNVAVNVNVLADEVSVAQVADENFSGNNLLPRQNLAYQRFSEYCTTNKGLLLLHNVGSGKTLTSLNMALTILAKQKASNDQLRIVVVLPTGLFSNFIKELKGKIPGVGNVIRKEIPYGDNIYKKLKIDNIYEFTYLSKKFEISEVLYRNINVRDQNKDIYTNFSDYISNSVVIFDEVHRLLRPSKIGKDITLCKDIIHNNKNVMSKCIKYIAMTGTPINKNINDIKLLMYFISNDSRLEDLDNKKYGILKTPDVIPYTTYSIPSVDVASYTDIAFFFQTSATVLTQAYVMYASSVAMTAIDSKLFPGASYIAGAVLTACYSSYTRSGGDPTGEIINMSEDKGINYINSQIEQYLKTKNMPQLEILDQLKDKINIDESLSFAGIDHQGFDEILKLYLLIYRNIITVNGKIDNNRIKILSALIYANRNGIKEIIDIIPNSGSFNFSILLKSAFNMLSYLLDKIVFQENIIVGGKGKKNIKIGGVKGSIFESLMNVGKDSIATIVEKATGIPIGFKSSVKNALNPYIGHFEIIDLWINGGMPFDITEYCKDVKKYISLSDSSIQSGLIQETYKINDTIEKLKNVLLKQSELNTEEKTNPDNYLKETLEYYKEIKNTPFKSNYPQKIECCFIMNYQENQIRFATLHNSKSLPNSTYEKLYIEMGNDTKLIAKLIGDYSDDILRYKCSKDSIETTGKYSYKYLTGDENDTPLEELPPWTFGCTKFNNVLANLLFMRTGYMKVFDEKFADQHYIIHQPHFTDRPVEPPLKEDAQIPRLAKITLDDGTEIEAPYVVTDASASYNYLPIVYSVDDELGLGLFAGFLESLKFKYILIHDDARKQEQENKKLESYMPVYMGDEKFEGSPGVRNNLVAEKYKEILKNIQERNVDSYDRTRPICVLLHNAMTEGIDFKYNPGIFLLEVPKTYGDYDQLCGRVLRTYPSKDYNKNWQDYHKQKNFKDDIYRWRLPSKVIYQVLCLTSQDRKLLESLSRNIDSTSYISPSKYIAPNILNASNTDRALLPLTNETLASKVYNSGNYVWSSFTGPDCLQWYDLLVQKSQFNKFIQILNKTSNEQEAFTGLTDLQEIINCITEDKNITEDKKEEKLTKPMCKEIPAKLTKGEYIEIRKLLNSPDGVKRFKEIYCAGDFIKNKASTIRMNLNPEFIEKKQEIQKDTKECLKKAGADEEEQNKCKNDELTKIRNARYGLERTAREQYDKSSTQLTEQPTELPTTKSPVKPTAAATQPVATTAQPRSNIHHALRPDPKQTTFLDPSTGNSVVPKTRGGKNRKRTHKRKQILIKQRFTKKRRFNKKNKNTRKKSKYFLKRNVTKSLNK